MDAPAPHHFPASERAPQRLTAINVAVSVAIAVPLMWVAFDFGTQLGLAQAADSTADSVTALALLYSLRIARQPADYNHPRGHQRAEPLAALFAAMMAGVLAFQVLLSAVDTLRHGYTPLLSWPVATVFALKLAARLALSSAAGRAFKRTGSPAVRALQVDARNDTLVSGLALAGYFAARYGWAGWDAWLAIPVAFWIAGAGLSLAAENVRMLMGESAPAERQDALHAIATQVPGVKSVHDVTARYEGPSLEVALHIVVDEQLSLRRAHDIAEDVERRLRQEPDIVHATVHVDVDAG